jgi:hypothetical protein
MDRRHFLRHMIGAGMTFPMLDWVNGFHAARAASAPARGPSMILIWLSGGPSTIDIWDLKPGTKNGGEFKPISTTGSGQICEHLPRLAKQMKHLSIIRSYTSRDGSHERGTYINHTAFAPVTSVIHPALGAVVAKYNTPGNLEVPGHISLGGPGVSPGFLGAAYAPFRVEAGDNPIPNIKSYVDNVRLERRNALLGKMQDSFVKQGRGELPGEHNTILGRAQELMSSKLLDAFKIDKVSAGRREKFGDHQFGRNCLLAAELVEIGVPFIEIGLGGWDNHQGIFDALADSPRALLPQLDQGFGSLVEDLAERGLLASTTVCCMGDFGRTPKINQDTGRDHWPTGWSVVLGGGKIKGGEVVGAMSDDGTEIADRPVDVSNLFATLYESVGVSAATELRSPNGRPLKLVGTFGSGDAVREILS